MKDYFSFTYLSMWIDENEVDRVGFEPTTSCKLDWYSNEYNLPSRRKLPSCATGPMTYANLLSLIQTSNYIQWILIINLLVSNFGVVIELSGVPYMIFFLTNYQTKNQIMAEYQKLSANKINHTFCHRVDT